MKSLLLPVEANDVMPSVLETAWLLAAKLGATVEGIALRPSLVDFVVPDPMGALVVQTPTWEEGEAQTAARLRLERFRSERAALGSDPAPAINWRGTSSIDDFALGSMARVFDATVLGRPGVTPSAPRMTTLEVALFESGRPVLVAPPTPPRSIGETVLIHWNASTETARAIAFALPLLTRARRVHVLSVEGAMAPGPAASELVTYLAAHGISAECLAAHSTSQLAGGVILDHARKLSCDLLVKGAYTQSRLRQMIFGGATSHILAHADLPVLLAH